MKRSLNQTSMSYLYSVEQFKKELETMQPVSDWEQHVKEQALEMCDTVLIEATILHDWLYELETGEGNRNFEFDVLNFDDLSEGVH